MKHEGILDTSNQFPAVNVIAEHLKKHFFHPSQVAADPEPAARLEIETSSCLCYSHLEASAQLRQSLNEGWKNEGITCTESNDGMTRHWLFFSRVKPA